MFRHLLLAAFVCLGSQTASALSFDFHGCRFEDVKGQINFTADLATAPIGAQVAEFDASGTIKKCGVVNGFRARRELYLEMQPYSTDNRLCMTTIPNIELRFASGFCSGNEGDAGPLLFGNEVNGTYPQFQQSTHMTFVKVGPVPPGHYILAPLDTSLVAFLMGTLTYWYRLNLQLPVEGGDVEVASCSLFSTDIKVDFGNASEPNREKPFNIEIGNCIDSADVANYVAATSLSFHSERISADGWTLRNGNCADCASGVQIALKDGRGNAINLNQRYALKRHSAVVTSPTGLTLNFSAELQENPNEALMPGAIDTQLVFETILE